MPVVPMGGSKQHKHDVDGTDRQEPFVRPGGRAVSRGIVERFGIVAAVHFLVAAGGRPRSSNTTTSPATITSHSEVQAADGTVDTFGCAPWSTAAWRQSFR